MNGTDNQERDSELQIDEIIKEIVERKMKQAKNEIPGFSRAQTYLTSSKRRKRPLPVLRYLVYLLIVTLVISGVSLSRYSTSSSSGDTARTAKWSIVVTGNDIEMGTSHTGNLTFTCSSDPCVASGKIAPGLAANTSFSIVSTGTETVFQYKVVLGPITSTPAGFSMKINGTAAVASGGLYTCAGTVAVPAGGVMTAAQTVNVSIAIAWDSANAYTVSGTAVSGWVSSLNMPVNVTVSQID